MGIHTSANARLTDPPTMVITGEIQLPDGRTHLVPVRSPDDWKLSDSYVISQDISAIQQEARVPSYPVPSPTPDYVTITGVMRAVQKGPQVHRNRLEGTPRWAVASVVVGSFLAVLGLGFTNPVAQLIWSWVSG